MTFFEMLRQLASLLILPANALVTIPGLLYRICEKRPSLRLFPPSLVHGGVNNSRVRCRLRQAQAAAFRTLSLSKGELKLRPYFRPDVLAPITWLLGVVSILTGLPLMILTIRDFIKVGQGTLAPWDPTQKLVVRGPYRYVRNPMISGVIFVLFGEALIFNTVCHVVWATFFTIANMIYIPISEEPGLEERFGSDYQTYKQHVPRWIPRRTPWSQY